MKRCLPLFTVACLLMYATNLHAQCDLNATITPGDVILCPNATDTLTTTESFDSYQWFKNNKPIEGATSAFYIVEQYRDAPSFFKVAVTRNGCADTSDRVLVDGYAFLPPFVITSGDPGVYDPFKDVTFHCPDDKITLTLGDPYTTNIQWYNSGKAIEGATSKNYKVTENGSYTVCGSPEVCPSFNSCMGIPLNYFFTKVDATVSQKGDTLLTDSKAKNYQWYFNASPIPGAKDAYIIPTRTGNYKVGINTKYNCTDLSEPYYYSAAANLEIITVSPNPVNSMLHVTIRKEGVTQIVVADFYGNRYKQIPYRNSETYINVSDLRTGTYVVQLLNNKQQLIGSVKVFKQ